MANPGALMRPSFPIATVSSALAAILEIRNVAIDHKKHCDHNCNVSLGGLKRAAEVILPLVPESERAFALDYIAAIPWF